MAANYDLNNFDDYLLSKGMGMADYNSMPLWEQSDLQREFELGRRVAQAQPQVPVQAPVQATPAVVPASASSVREAMDQIKAGTFTGLKIDPNASPTAFPARPVRNTPPPRKNPPKVKEKAKGGDSSQSSQSWVDKNYGGIVESAKQAEKEGPYFPSSEVERVRASVAQQLGRSNFTGIDINEAFAPYSNPAYDSMWDYVKKDGNEVPFSTSGLSTAGLARIDDPHLLDYYAQRYAGQARGAFASARASALRR